jgi:hypothetical protein
MKTNYLFAIIMVAVILVAGGAVRHSIAPTDSTRKPLYYTCPMHPSVRESAPGFCPICGMNLVPVYAENTQTNSAVSLTPMVCCAAPASATSANP